MTVIVKYPEVYADGVYFDMPDSDYHAIPALSSSGIKNLLISNPDFWYRSPFNQNRRDENTEAMAIGTAFHKRILEGRNRFCERYAVRFDDVEKPDNCLRTNDEIKAAITALDQKPKGKVKAEYIDQLLSLNPSAAVYENLEADYKQRHAGKEFLSHDLISSIEVAAAMIESHHALSKCFKGGYPEVTVLWTESDIRFKARFDYLKPRAIVDLKTFANMLNKPVDSAIIGAMASGKYHIQSAFYLRAAQAAKRLPYWHGCAVDFRQQFVECAEHDFYFVFQQKGIAPLARGKKFLRGSLWSCGEVAIDEAISRYKECMKTFGPDTPWIDNADIEEFEDDHFPPWTTEL